MLLLLLLLLLQVARQRARVVLQRGDGGLLVGRESGLRRRVAGRRGLHGGQQVLQALGVEGGDELLEAGGHGRGAGGGSVGWRRAVAGREAGWVRRGQAVGGLGREGVGLLGRLVAPHALLFAGDELDADLEVLVVVVVEFDVVGAGAGAVEEAQVDEPGVLIRAAEAADGEHAFDELAADDRVEVEAGAEVEDVDGEAAGLEGLFDPVDEVSVEVLGRDDLNVGNVLRRASRQRQAVVRIGRAGSTTEPASTAAVWGRTIAIAVVAVPVPTRRRRTVRPVRISLPVSSISSVSSVSPISSTIAHAATWIAISPSTVVRRARAATRVDRALILP